ncbi:MAG: 2OG-Fe(II) oxygenase [Phycisphaeraceae bacterium]
MKLYMDLSRLESLEPVIHKPGVVTIDNFLTTEQCHHLIDISEQGGFEAASVRLPGGAKRRTDIRNNDRYMIDDEELANSLWNGAELFSDAFDFEQRPVCLNERIRFYRYDPEQRFKRHRDGIEIIRDLTSKVTFMVYLNEDFEGGSTVFSDFTFEDGKRLEEKLDIAPKTGTALMFIHQLWHEGQILTTGRKYVLRTDVLYESTPEE